MILVDLGSNTKGERCCATIWLARRTNEYNELLSPNWFGTNDTCPYTTT